MGLVVRATGELLEPRFSVRMRDDYVEVRQVREAARRFALSDVRTGTLPGAFSCYPRAA